MKEIDFSDSALVIVGHGSTLNADSSAPTYQHADTIRDRGIFAQVIECFWKLEPSICGVLRGVWCPDVYVVPLFISEGYFTEEVIPRELGFSALPSASFPRVETISGHTVHYCGPVGTHSSMTSVLLSRARSVVETQPAEGAGNPSQTTLFIAGHGTGNNDNSRKAIEKQVDLIRSQGAYAAVHPLFMEEDPRIEQCYELAETSNIVIVPFFISDGLHSFEDIPMMLGESESDVKSRLKAGLPTWQNPTSRNGHRVWYSASIGSEPLMADVILERVKQAHVGNDACAPARA